MRPAFFFSLRRRHIVLFLVGMLSLALAVSQATAQIELPPIGVNAYIQTTGREAGLNIGDFRTNDTGDDLPHEVFVHLACTPNQTYTFELFDPAMDTAGNPPTNPAGVLDEDRGALDTTYFTLFAPDNTVVVSTSYAPNTSDGAWTTLTTVAMGANPVEGVDCGGYRLVATTGDGSGGTDLNNDDNAWRFRLDGVGFDPNDGPDGVVGTGDESWVGLFYISFQHLPGTCPGNDQSFYWFANYLETNMYMINFDLDNEGSVSYQSPGGDAITGTVSGETVWNDAAPQQQPRPVFGDMELFDPGSADLAGDAIADPEPGLWSATICTPITDYGFGSQNQYSFEVFAAGGNQVIFPQPINLAQLTVIKDDFISAVESPGQTTYDMTIANVSNAAAMPLDGAAPELVDTLPAELSFVSCQVLAPLVGTCAENPPGSGVIEFQLEAQGGGVLAYLPAGGSGTVRVTANVAAGLTPPIQIINPATVEWTDIYHNVYPPVDDDDVNTIGQAAPTVVPPPAPPGPGSPPLSVVKQANRQQANIGDTVVFTVNVTNTGGAPIDDVVVTDDINAALDVVQVTSTRGVVTVTGNRVEVAIGTMNPGETVTITITTRVSQRAVAGTTIPNVAVAASPATGSVPSNVVEVAIGLGVDQLPPLGEAPVDG